MTTFLLIGAAGIVLLLVALLLGDLLEFGLDIDFVAGLDSDVFSTAGVAGLLGGFGFGGAIGLSISANSWIAIGVGLVVGVLLAILAGKLTALLRRQGADGAFKVDSLVGVEAVLITPIPADGYGQVRVSYGGHAHTLNAKSATAIDMGTRVWVSQVLSATSVEVSPIELMPG